jgi:methylated-DNA-[protein]-cysteine S-methyltransferase
MTVQRFALFDTAIGRCAIVWSGRGVAGVQLPEGDDVKARARLARRFPDAAESPPSPAIAAIIERIAALLSGGRTDLSDVTLDTSALSDFQSQVYAIARSIPPGETLTYGEIAERLGDKLLSRDVGQAMGQNPYPIVVPCHRVVAANGKLGGFSARGGADTKLKMLAIEGAAVGGQPDLFG